MSSRQRRHGLVAQVWPSHDITDSRGNTQRQVDLDADPIVVRCAIIPQRSGRAEVPGQLAINVVRMIVAPDLEDVDLWSRVAVAGSTWDVVTPPAYHHGSRKVRHWSIDLRERP